MPFEIVGALYNSDRRLSKACSVLRTPKSRLKGGVLRKPSTLGELKNSRWKLASSGSEGEHLPFQALHCALRSSEPDNAQQ